MKEVVLDASVVLAWFSDETERQTEAALEFREKFESGELHILAPSLLWLEVLNVAARRRWEEGNLTGLAIRLPDLGFEIIEPELESVAYWSGKGLTAYDAAYVTVAEGAGVKLVTDDSQIVSIAPDIAISLN